jgi:hypothetical protein
MSLTEKRAGPVTNPLIKRHQVIQQNQWLFRQIPFFARIERITLSGFVGMKTWHLDEFINGST